jgi:uncharacterized Ntn-hydrolase superfamily protein
VTFSLVARCERTGQVGVGVATSDIAVGSRVPHAAAGVGAIATQHRTDPRLGLRGLALLRSGCDARATVDALVASTPQHAWRQVAVVDARGGAVTFSGDGVQPIFTDLIGAGRAAIGNMLASERVGSVVLAAAADGGEPLAERLVRALEAGLDAGGEVAPLRSAAVLVAGDQPFPLVDLRVDLDDQPVARLRAVWDAYRPRVDEFVLRALDPDRVDAEVLT